MKKTTALFGGSFKPPTKGHLEVILKGLKENSEVDKIIITVGKGKRGNITQEKSIKIWEIYQRLIPVESEIIATESPYWFWKEYLKENKEDKVYVFIGARPDNEKDRIDVLERSQYVKKYSKNVFPVKVLTEDGMSGTNSRKKLKENLEEFYNTLPIDLTEEEKYQVHLILEGEKLKKYIEKLKGGFKKFIEALKQERKETKEAFKLLSQSVKGEKQLSKEEKKEIGNQMKDVLKVAGFTAASVLPGGVIYLMLSRIPALKKSLTPSAFINESSEDKILYAFDLDDTLITSKSDVIVTNPEQGTFKLTPAEYALYEPGPNDELDFSEFAKLKNPKIIKDNFELFSKILEKSSNLPNAKTIILTARQPEVSTDLEAFLEKRNLPQVTLHAVGSSDPEEKLKVIQNYIGKGFNKIRFYDDSPKNIKSIKSLNSPEIDVKAKLVKHGPLKEFIMEEDKNDPFGLVQFINEVLKEEEFDYDPYIDSLNDFMLDSGINIDPFPSVIFIDDDIENAQDLFGKTAFYNPNQHEVTLFTMGRHPKDILRSYAHELIHHNQNLEDRLGNITTTDTREDDHLTDLEREAYTNGNLTFRKWTETLTEGQINELNIRNPKEIKFWALYADYFSILRKDPSKFEELESKLEGDKLEALYYFWDLLERGELNEELDIQDKNYTFNKNCDCGQPV